MGRLWTVRQRAVLPVCPDGGSRKGAGSRTSYLGGMGGATSPRFCRGRHLPAPRRLVPTEKDPTGRGRRHRSVRQSRQCPHRKRLCCSATRIHIATPCYTNSGDCLQPIPLLPNVHTVVLRVHAAELAAFEDVAIADALHILWSRCSKIRELHLLLWGDIELPSGVFGSIGWPRKGRIRYEQLMNLVDRSYVLMEDLYHHLCSAVEELELKDLEVLQLYNVEAVLERFVKMDDGRRWLTGETTESLLKGVEKAFRWEPDDSSVDETSEEEVPAVVSFHPAVAFFDAFGSYGVEKEDAWYRSSVIEPSAKLSALRQQLADRTKQIADQFIGLNEKEIEEILEDLSGLGLDVVRGRGRRDFEL